MLLADLRASHARFTELLRHLLRKHRAQFRLPAVPSHVHAFAVMGKVIEIQPTLISVGPNHAPHQFGKPGLAISREAHHLIFVAELGKTKELRERGVEDAQRVREGDRSSYLYLIVHPHSPHYAAEITETVDGDDCGLLKRRSEERAGKMRPVMLDKMYLPCPLRNDSLCQ